MPRKTGRANIARVRSLLASMRPRPDAAENARTPRSSSTQGPGFNEAAARCRGKRFAACRTPRTRARFNEAAARCRGKHKVRSFMASLACELQ